MTASRPPAQALTEDEAQVAARFEAAEAAPESFRPLPGEIAMHRAMNASPEQITALQDVAATVTAPRVPLGVLDELEAALAREVARHGIGIGVDQRLVLCTCGWRNHDEANLSRPLAAWAFHVAGEHLSGPLAPVLAAVRAVEEVAAWCEEQAQSRSHFAKVDPTYRIAVIPYEATAERLRAALSSALGAEGAGS